MKVLKVNLGIDAAKDNCEYFNSRLQGLLHFLDLNISGSLESSSIISKGDKNRYLISSIMEEAIVSGQIEGAATTRKRAKDMLRKILNIEINRSK